jgi:hypothetical protein
VEAGQQLAQLAHLDRAELARGQAPFPQGVLREALHAHRDVEHRAIATDRRVRVAAVDRDHAEVDAGRQRRVEPQLFLATVAARREVAVIEPVVAQYLLEFVGMVAGQQHPGDMGFD